MSELTQVLRHLTPLEDANSLVDLTTGDDAAVYSLGGGRALVVSLDFFTPVVDDPYDYGRIAATNALSDIYAMGGKPLFALNLFGFPRELLKEGLAEEILRGGQDAANKAEVPIMGGHSVDDAEPKYGLVVVGEVKEDAVVTNSNAKEGDNLILTKPIGTGIITTAIKAGQATTISADAAISAMTELNRDAARAMTEVGVLAATDVTGYGLLGHLGTMLLHSEVAAELVMDAVPVLPDVHKLISKGHVPSGTKRNLADIQHRIDFSATEDSDQLILADAQTAGGLLICVADEQTSELMELLGNSTFRPSIVGKIVSGDPGTIKVV